MVSWTVSVWCLLLLLCSLARGVDDDLIVFDDESGNESDFYQNSQYRGNIPPFISVRTDLF